MFKLRIFQGKELQTEKRKDYRNVVLMQVLIIVLGLTLSEFLVEGEQTTPASKFVISVFTMFGVTYSFLLWDLLRDFTSNSLLINTVLIVLSAVVVVGMLSEFPYYQVLHWENRRYLLMLLHLPVFLVEVTIIGFAIRDIFSGEYLTPDKLWGAAAVYLMIGISFGSLFHLLCIFRPGSLGDNLDIGFANYAECSAYTMSILGGADPGHPSATRLIKNIGVIEAVWSNLFVVLIIGKLMTLPRPPKSEDNNPVTP
jgi:hypothetical protein